MAWCRWEVSMWYVQVSRAEGDCVAGKEEKTEEEEAEEEEMEAERQRLCQLDAFARLLINIQTNYIPMLIFSICVLELNKNDLSKP